jgi:hypothetical protein
MEISSLARVVRGEVREMAERANHRQPPAYYDSLVGKFCVAGPCDDVPVRTK